MNVGVEELIQEIGRLHIQVMVQQQLINRQQAQIVELTPKSMQNGAVETPKA